MAQMYFVAIPTTTQGQVRNLKVQGPTIVLPSRTMEIIQQVRTAIRKMRNA